MTYEKMGSFFTVVIAGAEALYNVHTASEEEAEARYRAQQVKNAIEDAEKIEGRSLGILSEAERRYGETEARGKEMWTQIGLSAAVLAGLVVVGIIASTKG